MEDPEDLISVYNFPTVDETNFEQLFEVTSVHPLRKGVSTMSYSRVKEVQRDYPNIDTFEELVELMQDSLDDLEIFARRVSRKPAGYTNLEGIGVLPDLGGIFFSSNFINKFLIYFLKKVELRLLSIT